MSGEIDLVAFEAAYRREFTFAWRALRRLGVPERDLGDAAQDVFLVVYRKFNDFDFQRPMSAWVYAICLRVASDRRRSAVHRNEHLTAAGDHAEPAESPGSDETEHARDAEHRALLQAALDAMSNEQRAVFTWFELEGHTGEQVAALLGVPVATVHSRLRLAREVFRRTVARERAREHFELRRIGGTHD